MRRASRCRNRKTSGDRDLRLWITPTGFIQAALAAGNANVTDHYYGRQNRTVKVVVIYHQSLRSAAAAVHPAFGRRVQ